MSKPSTHATIQVSREFSAKGNESPSGTYQLTVMSGQFPNLFPGEVCPLEVPSQLRDSLESLRSWVGGREGGRQAGRESIVLK